MGPAKADASRNSGEEATLERIVRQTADANFARLAATLEAAEAIQPLDAFDEAIFNDLRRGEVLEIECRLSVPFLVKLGLLFGTVPVSELATAFGEQLDAETETVMEQIGMLIGLLKAVPAIAEAAAAPRFKFIAPLEPESLRVALDDLDGEATMMATVERKLKPSEKWSLLDAMGLGMIPREHRREVERGLRQVKELRDSVVSAPAALVSPVARYR